MGCAYSATAATRTLREPTGSLLSERSNEGSASKTHVENEVNVSNAPADTVSVVPMTHAPTAQAVEFAASPTAVLDGAAATNGTWRKEQGRREFAIAHGKVLLPGGSIELTLKDNGNSVSMDHEGEACAGVVEHGGKRIVWDDGEVWIRVEHDVEEAAPEGETPPLPNAHDTEVTRSDARHMDEDWHQQVAPEPSASVLLGAILCARQTLEDAEEAFGSEHAQVAILCSSLADVLERDGRFNEAVPLYRRALAIDEKVLGKTHPRVSVDCCNLSAVLRALGDMEQAQALQTRMDSIDKKGSSLQLSVPNIFQPHTRRKQRGFQEGDARVDTRMPDLLSGGTGHFD